ncbi:nitroreductase [Bradyrhizobium sp. LA6.1]
MKMGVAVDSLRDNPTAKALDRIARSRWSCRDYRPDQVSPALLNEILVVAQTAASWCNTQPWHIEVTRGRATTEFIDALALARADASEVPDFTWPEYEGIYLQRRRESGFQLYEALGISRGDRVRRDEQADKNFKLFGAPHVAIITTDARLGVYGAIDCGGWVTNFMLAAKSGASPPLLRPLWLDIRISFGGISRSTGADSWSAAFPLDFLTRRAGRICIEPAARQLLKRCVFTNETVLLLTVDRVETASYQRLR